MSLGQSNRRKNLESLKISGPHFPLASHFDPYGKHTAKIKSRRAGEPFSARWLYTFSKVPFYCLQQRKMERFSPRQKLTHTDALCGADPHLDPHGETNGWNTWSKAFSTSSFLRQKRPQALIYQRLEGILSLEVGGSNPPSSSKRPCFLLKTGVFLCLFFLYG